MRSLLRFVSATGVAACLWASAPLVAQVHLDPSKLKIVDADVTPRAAR